MGAIWEKLAIEVVKEAANDADYGVALLQMVLLI